jgi:hypothetical protein
VSVRQIDTIEQRQNKANNTGRNSFNAAFFPLTLPMILPLFTESERAKIKKVNYRYVFLVKKESSTTRNAT